MEKNTRELNMEEMDKISGGIENRKYDPGYQDPKQYQETDRKNNNQEMQRVGIINPPLPDRP